MDSEDGHTNLLGLDLASLVPYLVKSIQELNKKIDDQQQQILELRSVK
jgi:hypothetical protein